MSEKPGNFISVTSLEATVIMIDNTKVYDVGCMSQFRNVSLIEVVDKLHEIKVFEVLPDLYCDKVKLHVNVFESRIENALNSNNDEDWKNLCNEPRGTLRALWKLQKHEINANRQEAGAIKNAMQIFYYSLYTIILWRNEKSKIRYEQYAIPFARFKKMYDEDVNFPHNRINNDSWDLLFSFRNVLILASAIKPTYRNKGLFIKIGSVLSENRVHALGGGQSYAADRRGYIYDREGVLYVLQVPPLLYAIDDNNPVNVISNPPADSPEPVSTPKRMKKVDTEKISTSSAESTLQLDICRVHHNSLAPVHAESEDETVELGMLSNEEDDTFENILLGSSFDIPDHTEIVDDNSLSAYPLNFNNPNDFDSLCTFFQHDFSDGTIKRASNSLAPMDLNKVTENK